MVQQQSSNLQHSGNRFPSDCAIRLPLIQLLDSQSNSRHPRMQGVSHVVKQLNNLRHAHARFPVFSFDESSGRLMDVEV